MTQFNFNDANGTPEQQVCQSYCGIYDAGTGNAERKNRDGEPFDVKYKIIEGKLSLTQFADKCVSCSHWNTFKEENEP